MSTGRESRWRLKPEYSEKSIFIISTAFQNMLLYAFTIKLHERQSIMTKKKENWKIRCINLFFLVNLVRNKWKVSNTNSRNILINKTFKNSLCSIYLEVKENLFFKGRIAIPVNLPKRNKHILIKKFLSSRIQIFNIQK